MATFLLRRPLGIGLRILEDKVPVLEFVRSREVRGVDHVEAGLRRPVEAVLWPVLSLD